MIKLMNVVFVPAGVLTATRPLQAGASADVVGVQERPVVLLEVLTKSVTVVAGDAQ